MPEQRRALPSEEGRSGVGPKFLGLHATDYYYVALYSRHAAGSPRAEALRRLSVQGEHQLSWCGSVLSKPSWAACRQVCKGGVVPIVPSDAMVVAWLSPWGSWVLQRFQGLTWAWRGADMVGQGCKNLESQPPLRLARQ